MKRVAFGLLLAVPGYLIGAVGGAWIISVLTSNPHDASVESAMTGAFVTGPFVALSAFIVGFVRGKPRA